jgi:two-component system NtrC family sensor kinase
MYTLVMNPDRARLIQSEKMSAAGNLLAGIVHELNNPLTTILGFSELLLKEGNGADAGRLEKIHSEAERSVRIIQNLLRLARADHGNPEAIDINESIRRTVELAQYQIRLNRIDLDLNLSSKSPQAIAHSGALTQVILNLVTNAIQAISGVRPSGTIEITSAVIGDRVLVSVIDDGPGIGESHLHRLFEPFFTTKETGTGLGLSLSRNIIREVGGDMWAASTKGCGATFTLELPVVMSGIEAGDDVALDDPVFLTPDRSVLIVDDETHITELIESVLRNCGFQTDRLNDGAPAIEFLKAREYDILICDLHMPGISGRELIEWTRQNRQNVRILLLSGDVARRETNDFAKNYGIQFLSKPFSVSELKKAVQRLAS